MSRWLLFPLLVVLLGIVAMYVAGTDRDARPVDVSADHAEHGYAGRPEPAEPGPSARVEPLRAAAVDAAEEPAEPPADAAPEAEAAPPVARLVGRVTDADGDPLEGVELELRTVGEPWRRGEAVPGSYRARTDAGGRYAFEVVLPTSDWISLTVEPGPYHALEGRAFGPAGGRNQPRLRPGRQEVPAFVLPQAGAVAGSVADELGAPIDGATVRFVAGTHPKGYAIRGESDASGRFVLGHAPPGRQRLSVLREGYLSEEHEVDVEVGGELELEPFVLAVAPRLEGSVVDEAGAGLDSVELWGWPSSGSGWGAGGETGADGRFSVPLPQDEPYSMGAEREGYGTIEPDRAKVYAPGEEVVIVMRRARRTRFLVRSAETKEPIEEFALALHPEEGGIGYEHLRLEPSRHRGGTVELAGEPRRHEYVALAPGYAPRSGAVEADGEQVVELLPPASLHGRVAGPNGPIPRPTVRVREWFEDDFGTASRFERRPVEVQGDVSGSFEVTDLAAGAYRVSVSASDRAFAPLDAGRIELAVGEERDLGELSLPRAASIELVVTLGEQASPAGIRVGVGDEWYPDYDTLQVTDAEGRARFDGLRAGSHHVWAEAKAGVLAAPGGWLHLAERRLSAGERALVEVDASDAVPCRATVHFRSAGEAVEDVLIFARSERQAQALGRTDALGVAEGEVYRDTEARFTAYSARGLPLGQSAPVHLAPGAGLAPGSKRPRES